MKDLKSVNEWLFENNDCITGMTNDDVDEDEGLNTKGGSSSGSSITDWRVHGNILGALKRIEIIIIINQFMPFLSHTEYYFLWKYHTIISRTKKTC